LQRVGRELLSKEYNISLVFLGMGSFQIISLNTLQRVDRDACVKQTRQSIHGDENSVTSTGDPTRGTSGGRSRSLEPDKGTGYTERVRGTGDAVHRKLSLWEAGTVLSGPIVLREYISSHQVIKRVRAPQFMLILPN